ncbi:pyridoxal kinase isoform X2 [Aethina tumida]|uniref:pyridoxal kinase isoform X2 n=1 Tax=Aethina tumida TaxID=116153 RepID=UPI00096B2533|nr:pyridoxal kinase isoform X2 [Aethina tumida]
MDGRVLSVQSHVVHGYVGNKSAVFPLQLLGFDVDNINSVQLSNHTGYKSFAGQVLTDKDLVQLSTGLIDNGLDEYSHILSGYIGSSSFLYEVTKLVTHLRTKNPDICYVCDPVMGDNGKLYVPQELVTIYKEFVVPLATILTPNLFEAELLTDLKINSVEDVWKAIEILHGRGCPTVVISSADLGDGELHVFASHKGADVKRVTMKIPKIPAQFTGTGDLFAALFLAWMYKTQDLKESVEKTIASLQAVLTRTYEHVSGKEMNVKNLELKLIQSKKDIEEPQIKYEAEIVD